MKDSAARINKTHTFDMRLTEIEWRRWKRHAKQSDISVAALVRSLMEQEVSR